MDFKKALLVTLGGTAIGAGLGGKKGIEIGLGLGITVGLLTGLTLGVLGSTIFVVGKSKIKKCRA